MGNGISKFREKVVPLSSSVYMSYRTKLFEEYSSRKYRPSKNSSKIKGEGTTFPRNAGNRLPLETASHHKRK